jgi:hypothetical protein
VRGSKEARASGQVFWNQACPPIWAIQAEIGVDPQAAHQQAINSGNPDEVPDAVYCLGLLLAEEGDIAGARAAYQQAINSGIPEVATLAAANRAKLPRQRSRHRAAPTSAGRVGEDRSRPVLSNRELVGRGLEFLASGLGQFTSTCPPPSSPDAKDWAEALAARDRTRGVSVREYRLSDPRIQLRIMSEEWKAFRDELSPVPRSTHQNCEISATGGLMARHSPPPMSTERWTPWSACSLW